VQGQSKPATWDVIPIKTLNLGCSPHLLLTLFQNGGELPTLPVQELPGMMA